MDVALVGEIFKTIIGVMGIIGNGLVCVVIAKVPAMRTLINAFIFNQAVIDFLGSLFIILRSLIQAPLVLHQSGLLAFIQCNVWISTVALWIFFVTSTLNLALLTAERYVAIVYPFKYLSCFGKKQATVMMVAVWVLAVGFKCSNFVYYEVANRTCILNDLSPKANMTLGTVGFLVEYLIPLIFMTFCYIHIIIQLKKASSNVGPEPTTSQQRDNTMSGSLLRARRNTLKTLFIVFVSYIICWSPNQIAFFLYNFGLNLDFFGTFFYISIVLAQLNTCVNPLIYAFKYKQFQGGVRVLFKPCFSKLTATNNTEQPVPTISRDQQPRRDA